jgi:ankyrin repeat protein
LIAILEKHQGSASLLLSHKDINADARDNTGRSPLSWAAENGDEELVTLLLEREDVEVQSKDNGGRTPLE